MSVSESEAYKTSADIRSFASGGGQKLTQPPATAIPLFILSSALTVLVWSQFRGLVSVKFTEENTRSTSTLVWGKHNKQRLHKRTYTYVKYRNFLLLSHLHV